jgi:hypothetical protein
MSVNKPEKYAHELTIFACRTEQGLETMRRWLRDHRDGIRWTDLDGVDLSRAQGEARFANRLIKMLEVGPTNKGEA